MLFPLRTGVELFSDPTMPGAAARTKQAAVLYDEVVFETGLYEVSIAEGGSNYWWHPQELLTDEDLVDRRRVQTPGTPFRIALGIDGSSRMVEFINSPLVVAYASEYHSGILDELARFEPEWVKVLTLGNKPPAGTPDGNLFRRRFFRERFDATLMPESRDEGQYKRRWIIEVFNRDLVAASAINATFNPTTLFAPIVERRGWGTPLDGREALGIAVPNVGALPWEAVVEFRDHAGSTEARAMLREFEEKAAHEEPEDA